MKLKIGAITITALIVAKTEAPFVRSYESFMMALTIETVAAAQALAES